MTLRNPIHERFVTPVQHSEELNDDTIPMQDVGGTRGSLPPTLPTAHHRVRRSLLTVGGAFCLTSLLGLGVGVTTTLAQRYLQQRVSRIPSFPTTSASSPTIPHSLSLRMQTLFPVHQHTVRAVAWSPDGTSVASGDDDALVSLWRRDGTVLFTWHFLSPVHALAWSPDGTQLAVGTGNSVVFVDTQIGTVLAERGQHTGIVTALGWTALTEAGAPLALSASEDKTAIAWQTFSYQPLMTFRLHTTPILALAVLSDMVATASEGGVVRIWNPSNGQEVHGYLTASAHACRAIAWASTGALATGSDNGVLALWPTGLVCHLEQQDTFGLHCMDQPQLLLRQTAPICTMSFSPDGRWLVSGGDDQRLLLWFLPTSTVVATLPFQESLLATSWSADGHLAIASGPQVTIWQVLT